MGNTTQFKSHNGSQNLSLDFVIRTIQREAIFWETVKKNSKYYNTCTTLWNAKTVISATRSYLICSK